MAIKKVIDAIKEFCECKDCKDEQALTKCDCGQDDCSCNDEHKDDCDCNDCKE